MKNIQQENQRLCKLIPTGQTFEIEIEDILTAVNSWKTLLTY
jgi:hypothetical protein